MRPNRAARSLLAGLAGLALLGSCRSGAELDLDFREQTDLSGAELIDTFSVKGQTVQYPNIATEPGSTVTLGQTNDPRTGIVTASAFLSLSPSNTTGPAFTRGNSDSVFVRLPYQLTSPGRGVDVTFKLYALTEAFSDSRAYFSNDSLTAEADPLATVTINQLDTVKRNRFVTFVITSDYGRRIVDYLAANGYKGQNDAGLKSLIKGFKVTAEVPTNTVLTSELSLATQVFARLKYNFYRPDASGSTVLVDTTVSFAFGTGGRHFTRFKANRSAAEIAGASLNGDTLTTTSGRVYVQNGVPLWGLIKIPGLTTIQNDLKRVAVVKAELVLTNDYDSYRPGRNASLLVFKQNAHPRELSRNQILDNALDNEELSTSTINFLNDSASGQFRLNITRYVQSVFNGTQANNGLYISMPVAERTLMPYTFSTGAADSRRARLKVYFVRLSTGL